MTLGKQVEKMLSQIAKRPMFQHGSTWHSELLDKVASIRTHIHYSIRNCEKNLLLLRQKLDKIVLHYKIVPLNQDVERIKIINC